MRNVSAVCKCMLHCLSSNCLDMGLTPTDSIHSSNAICAVDLNQSTPKTYLCPCAK